MMGDLSRNFSRDEFACNCGCGFDTVDADLLAVLQATRDHYGRAVNINSGCRCAAWNRREGGAADSQHLFGRAADFTVAGHAPWRVRQWLREAFPRVSIGAYGSFTHVDTRTDGPANW